MGNSTNTSSQLMKLETLLCAKLFWRMEVPAKKFSRIPGPSRPMLLSIWKKSLKVIFVTGTSPLKPTEKCTLEGITKSKMMKPNISVNICGKTFDMESQLNNHRNLHRLQHHRMLQAQKKEEAERKAKEEAGEQGEPSSSQGGDSTSQPSSQAQPELSQPELSQPELSQPPLPQISNPQPPVSLPVSLNLPAHLTAQSSQMFAGQIVIGTAIKKQEEEEEMEIGEADD